MFESQDRSSKNVEMMFESQDRSNNKQEVMLSPVVKPNFCIFFIYLCMYVM